MRRGREIRELEATIHSRKRYRYDLWCRDFILPADNPNWAFIVIAGGDERERLDPEFVATHGKRVKLLEVDGVPNTVVKVRSGLCDSLRRAGNLRAFYKCLTSVLSEADVKRYHHPLWIAAHNLEANIGRLRELQTRSFRPKDAVGREVDGIFAGNTVREAAKHYRNF